MHEHSLAAHWDEALGITPHPCTPKDPVCGSSFFCFSLLSFAGGMLKLYSYSAQEDAEYCPKDPFNYTQELIETCIKEAMKTSERTDLASNIMFGLTGLTLLVAGSYLLSKRVESWQKEKLSLLCDKFQALPEPKRNIMSV